MENISVGASVKIYTGRIAKVSPRTCNTETGFIIWLTPQEINEIRPLGRSAGRYSYSVDLKGNVERWINGYGGYLCKVMAPTLI